MTYLKDSDAPITPFDAGRLPERNLERALLDFELANARVLDLTQRMLSLNNELVATRAELEEARRFIERSQIEKNAAVAEAAEIKSSLAYRGFRFLGDVRSKLLK